MFALPSKEWYVGVCLALVLQSNYRLVSGIGIGELGLASFICLTPFFKPRTLEERSLFAENFASRFLLYLVACLLPSTLLTHVSTGGSLIDPAVAWRDYCAYVLNGLFIWSIAIRQFDIRSCCFAFTISSIALMSLQYAGGGPDAWYGTRFTAGARNPNQLSLYCTAGMVIAANGFKGLHRIAPALMMLIFFGLTSKSDAFMLTVLLSIVVYMMAVAFPPRYLTLGLVVVMLAGTYLALFTIESVVESLGNQWSEADEGGGRLPLYINGVQAWLNSAWSVVFGNGAGAFSGQFHPFDNAEAHNTIIDSLAIGGLFGVMVLFDPPLRALWSAYTAKQPVVFAAMAGLLVFSCFHYVGRHPVFWFAVLATGEACRKGASAHPVKGLTRRPFPAAPAAKVGARLGAC